jgi:ribonuclease PH
MAAKPRADGREPGGLREIVFQRAFTRHAPGSVLACYGATKVLCTAMASEGVPAFLQGRGQGWLTAEYSMLPSSTADRKARDRGLKPDGRSIEIQRLIGRSLRAVVDLTRTTERTVWIDCDVLQADGGTRTAAISGAWVALHDLFSHMDAKRQLRGWPLRNQVAAVSVGVVDKQPMVDLAYGEDSRAETDMNLVMVDDGRFVEVQGSAEAAPFNQAELDGMLELGRAALARIFDLQRRALGRKPA